MRERQSGGDRHIIVFMAGAMTTGLAAWRSGRGDGVPVREQREKGDCVNDAVVSACEGAGHQTTGRQPLRPPSHTPRTGTPPPPPQSR